MINWQYFPKSDEAPAIVHAVVGVFNQAHSDIDSCRFDLNSNTVLSTICNPLQSIGFEVETGKSNHEKISIPVLFGLNGQPEKTFEADAYHRDKTFVLEVEAGRAVVNNQFMKDLFQACLMTNVNYLGIAVRKKYRNSNDFKKVTRFIETLYASSRIRLPLKGILIIGY